MLGREFFLWLHQSFPAQQCFCILLVPVFFFFCFRIVFFSSSLATPQIQIEIIYLCNDVFLQFSSKIEIPYTQFSTLDLAQFWNMQSEDPKSPSFFCHNPLIFFVVSKSFFFQRENSNFFIVLYLLKVYRFSYLLLKSLTLLIFFIPIFYNNSSIFLICVYSVYFP